ncbi:hypothetical protein OG985_43585 [Streptomyces sp. NBC_00289]
MPIQKGAAVVPRHTTAGVPDAQVTGHPVTTDDGLGLQLTRFRRAECDDVVLLVHGLTASSDLFIMPEHRNLATCLLDNGFADVWALDMRMSNRFPYNTEPHAHTLDDGAAARPSSSGRAHSWGRSPARSAADTPTIRSGTGDAS